MLALTVFFCNFWLLSLLLFVMGYTQAYCNSGPTPEYSDCPICSICSVCCWLAYFLPCAQCRCLSSSFSQRNLRVSSTKMNSMPKPLHYFFIWRLQKRHYTVDLEGEESVIVCNSCNFICGSSIVSWWRCAFCSGDRTGGLPLCGFETWFFWWSF